VFSKNGFGFFDQVRKEKFGQTYRGMFRHACGPEPFIHVSEYQGSESFADGEFFVISGEKGTGLPLQPLLFWDECSRHPDLTAGHCYIFDKAQVSDGSFSYKAAGYPCTCTVSGTNRYKEAAAALIVHKASDSRVELIKGIKLRDMAID
jgi:hypothetical protein